MTEVSSLAAEARDRAGKGVARALRRSGRVPAVIYGDKKEPLAISLAAHDLSRELQQARRVGAAPRRRGETSERALMGGPVVGSGRGPGARACSRGPRHYKFEQPRGPTP